MRHEFMENLLLRAAKQEQLVMAVRANNERHKAEREARTNKTGLKAREAALDQTNERKRTQTHNIYEKQQQLQESANDKAEKAKEIRQKKKEATLLAKEQLAESKKAAGIARRVDHIQRSVQKAELEDSQLKNRQQQREMVKAIK